MVARGNTEENAKKNLKSFLKFTTCKVIRMTYNKIDYAEGNDKNNPKKDKLNSYNVYPAWMSVWNTKLVEIESKKAGAPTASGKLIGKRSKLYIFNQTETPGWQDQFNEVSKKSD